MTSAFTGLFERQQAQSKAQRCGPDLGTRRKTLADLARAIKSRQDQICAALAADFAKPQPEVLLTEILPVLQEIRHARRCLRRWMAPQRVAPGLATFGTAAQIIAQPRGVCLIIAPWNYPFMLAFGPLVSALAAGNRAIVKPSELTPATSALIAQIIADTFEPEQVSVAQGGREVAGALLKLPFDHIFFTGSPEVGKVVMTAAAQHLTSVTLELGGKSPVIVGPNADIASASKWIAFGKFGNGGQACIAPDHVYVHHSIKDAFLAALRARIARNHSEALAQIVNEAHAARLANLLADALSKGARMVIGAPAQGRALPPMVIENITPEMDIASNEIFGPILPILAYSEIATVTDSINARPNPLSLYIFETNNALISQVLAATTSGSVGINLTMVQFAHTNLPFGGVGSSGMGAAHGRAGFEAFSHRRTVLRNRFSLLPMLFPPFTRPVQSLIAQAMRVLG